MGESQDLKRIYGIDGLVEQVLNCLGINRYKHVANMTPGQRRQILDRLGMEGVIEIGEDVIARDEWIGAAKVLSNGGETAFSRHYDRVKVGAH